MFPGPSLVRATPNFPAQNWGTCPTSKMTVPLVFLASNSVQRLGSFKSTACQMPQSRPKVSDGPKASSRKPPSCGHWLRHSSPCKFDVHQLGSQQPHQIFKATPFPTCVLKSGTPKWSLRWPSHLVGKAGSQRAAVPGITGGLPSSGAWPDLGGQGLRISGPHQRIWTRNVDQVSDVLNPCT